MIIYVHIYVTYREREITCFQVGLFEETRGRRERKRE
jgi:hypothetical protein